MLVHAQRRRPPGPKGAPIIGSLPEFRRDMLGFLSRTARDYPGIFSFRVLVFNVVIVNEPELIQEFLTDTSGRLGIPWERRLLRSALGNGLLTNNDGTWRRQRKLLQPAFEQERLQGYAATIVEHAERMLDRWKGRDAFDLSKEMSQITLEVVAQTLFGANFDDHAREVADSMDVLMRSFEKTVTSAVPVPPTWRSLAAHRAMQRVDRAIYDLIDQGIAAPAGRAGVLGWMLEAERRGDEGMTRKQIRDELITLVLAGHETTAIAIVWTLMLLAQHPDVEKKVLAELDEVFGGAVPDGAGLGKLGYLRQVVNESMRLYPPAPAISREVREPFELGGYWMPRGTQMFAMSFLTHRDARFFPEPERFRPERWDRDAASPPPRHAFYPFGLGPHTCIGKSFAMMEVLLVLACILRRVKVELVPEHPIELQLAVTIRPRHGVKVRVSPRV